MAAPEIIKLIGCPSTVTLFPRDGSFGSDSTTLGATVLSLRDGDVVMRFELPADWTFDDGTQTQETTAPVRAGQNVDITMPYRLKTAIRDALDVRIRVVVRMTNETTVEARPCVQPVRYATMFERVTKFFGFGKEQK